MILLLAFDNKDKTFWASSTVVTETTKNCITINFTNRTVTPNTRRYDGYPLILNVYTSINKDDFRLRYTFNGSPTPIDFWTCVISIT